jgi:hypothetical protein
MDDGWKYDWVILKRTNSKIGLEIKIEQMIFFGFFL